MKRFTSRIVSVLLTACVVLAMLPALPAQALTTQSMGSKTVSSTKFKKVTNSSSTYAFLEGTTSGKYTAVVKGKPANTEYDIPHMKRLYVTSGTSEKVINLEKLIKDKYKLDSSYKLEFYHLTAIKGKFYITGAYGKEYIASEDANTKYFLISTTSGKTVSVKTIKKPMTNTFRCYNRPGWGLYYFKNQYVAMADCNTGVYNSAKDTTTYTYYKSSDLSTWTAVKMKPSTYSSNLAVKRGGTINMHVTGVTAKAIYYVEEVNGGANDGYTYLPTVHYMYTTDHTNFKAVTTLNDTITTNNNKYDYFNGVFEDFTRTLDAAPMGSKTFITTDVLSMTKSGEYYTTGFKAYTSSTVNGFKRVINFDKKWDYLVTTNSPDSKYGLVFFKTSSAKYMYRINGETSTVTKYSSTIDSEKLGGTCYKGSYIFHIYAGKYLLVTKNGGAKYYKINTGKSNLLDVNVAGDYLVLSGNKGYDYYVPLSTITAACK